MLDPGYFRKPGLGWLLRLIKTIPAEPGSPALGAAVRAALEAGELVAVFPEARPGADGELGAFDPPLAGLLGEFQVPIVPVGLNGLRASLFSRVPGARRSGALQAQVSLRVGAPLTPEAVPGMLREAMQTLL